MSFLSIVPQYHFENGRARKRWFGRGRWAVVIEDHTDEVVQKVFTRTLLGAGLVLARLARGDDDA